MVSNKQSLDKRIADHYGISEEQARELIDSLEALAALAVDQAFGDQPMTHCKGKETKYIDSKGSTRWNAVSRP